MQTLQPIKHGQTSVIFRVKLYDSAVTTQAGKTAMTFYPPASSSRRSPTTRRCRSPIPSPPARSRQSPLLGTYAAPTATKCRFLLVDDTNHPGIYEIHLADARFAVASAKSLMISISGVANLAQADILVPLTSVDPYDAVRAGLTALPNAGAAAANGLLINGVNTGTVSLADLTVVPRHVLCRRWSLRCPCR